MNGGVKMKFSKKVILGTVMIGTLAVASSAFAWHSYTKNIQARFAQIKLIVNGQEVNTRYTKAEPFIYNGNVYAPVATIANMLGDDQKWDNKVPAVRITKVLEPKISDEAKSIGEIENEINFNSGGLGHNVYVGHEKVSDLLFLADYNPGMSSWERQYIPHEQNDIGQNGYYMISKKFSNITGQHDTEFLAYGVETQDGKRVYSINVYWYDLANKKLNKIDHLPNIGYYGREFSTSPGIIDIKKYDTDHKLVSIEEYTFKDGKFVKTNEIGK
jgi:hypothetical protein